MAGVESVALGGGPMFPVHFGVVLLAGFTVNTTAAPVPKEGAPYVKWTVQAKPIAHQDNHLRAFGDPLVVGKLVVVADRRGTVAAYRCEDGTRAWVHEQGKEINSRLSTDGDRVYFTSFNRLIVLSVETGQEVWSHTFVHQAGPVCTVPGRSLVVVGCCNGKLYGVATDTRKQLWDSDFLADAPKPKPEFQDLCIPGPPARPAELAADREAVFLSVFDQYRLVAVAAATGKRLWAFEARRLISGPAVVSGDRVLIGSWDKHLYCLDRRNGSKVWEFATNEIITDACTTDGETVYIGSWDGGVYAVNWADGKQRWRFEVDHLPDDRTTAIRSLLLRDGLILFATEEGQFYAVDKLSGRLRWKFRPLEDSKLYCSPATDGSRYFVTSSLRDRGVGECALMAIGLR